MILNTTKQFFQNKLSSTTIKQIIVILVIATVFIIGVLAMTSREKGESFVTIQVKTEAKVTGKDPCDILAQWLSEAKLVGNKQLALKIEAAEKYMGCRNQQKRGKRGGFNELVCRSYNYGC